MRKYPALFLGHEAEMGSNRVEIAAQTTSLDREPSSLSNESQVGVRTSPFRGTWQAQRASALFPALIWRVIRFRSAWSRSAASGSPAQDSLGFRDGAFIVPSLHPKARSNDSKTWRPEFDRHSVHQVVGNRVRSSAHDFGDRGCDRGGDGGVVAGLAEVVGGDAPIVVGGVLGDVVMERGDGGLARSTVAGGPRGTRGRAGGSAAGRGWSRLGRVRSVSRSAAAVSRATSSAIEAGHDGRQVGGHDLEDRRPHQELLEIVRQVADDLLGEVVVQLLVGAAQAADELPDLGRRSVAKGGLDELERRGPALRSARRRRRGRPARARARRSR